MPWESGAWRFTGSYLKFADGVLHLGRCSFEAGSRHIDVRNVVWLGTSNIGHDVVSEHHASRARPDELMSREEYVQLMNMVREPVSKHMGVSWLASFLIGPGADHVRPRLQCYRGLQLFCRLFLSRVMSGLPSVRRRFTRSRGRWCLSFRRMLWTTLFVLLC